MEAAPLILFIYLSGIRSFSPINIILSLDEGSAVNTVLCPKLHSKNITSIYMEVII